MERLYQLAESSLLTFKMAAALVKNHKIVISETNTRRTKYGHQYYCCGHCEIECLHKWKQRNYHRGKKWLQKQAKKMTLYVNRMGYECRILQIQFPAGQSQFIHNDSDGNSYTIYILKQTAHYIKFTISTIDGIHLQQVESQFPKSSQVICKIFIKQHRSSKPCQNCTREIKKIGIKQIVYIDTDNQLQVVKSRDFTSEHISSGHLEYQKKHIAIAAI